LRNSCWLFTARILSGTCKTISRLRGHVIQLLHDVMMKSAIESDCEPVFCQAIPVRLVRKYNNRLRVKMLRAHMSKVFKTPGATIGAEHKAVAEAFTLSQGLLKLAITATDLQYSGSADEPTPRKDGHTLNH
jgi:hypothetical protein